MSYPEFFQRHYKSDILLSQRKKEDTKDTEGNIVYV
jgi:hypothetical protein